MTELLRDLVRIATRWLLWSPRHFLLGTLALIVTLAVAFSLISPHGSTAPTPKQVDIMSQPSGSSEVVVTTPPLISPGPSSTPDVVTDPVSTSTAAASSSSVPSMSSGIYGSAPLRFAAAYADTTRTPAEWRAALKPWTTDRLWRKLAGVSPDSVKVGLIRSQPVVTAAADGLVQLTAATSQHSIIMTLIRDKTGWLVDQVDVGS